MQFQQLMPVGYVKQPPLKTFVIAKIKKENTEKQIKLYKQKYHQYFYQHDYLKLVKQGKEKDHVLMLFCFPEDLEKMKVDFEVEEYIEIELPSIAPIHKDQKSLYNDYWNILHPNYEYPHKQNKDAALRMQQILDTKVTRNKCILYDEDNTIVIEAEDETHINNARHCVMVAMEKLAEHNKNENQQKHFHDLQYYAKEMTLVIYFEPCIMCAMALVHSRIKEVYYYQKRVVDGGLNDQLQLNNLKQLNHKYLVFYQH
ncbi:unnamed protein product (macronuclear) [Paramecium tetraurelia]|uniref:CMP/dCMP-type deaminase domain-containing protein n=1 Tax=Paramecium tetraurelia TaxID=5888 RepID=A0CBX1_PARTE|nr:uncharacterized protein GSPATT00037071001 [Paramecium tetraurelia]CAK68288.1 unnamed protein product [Paramecium tetraurelia]|eukprot:XP_001435685.1 hypothetical protein (macronuclear) [Paramecium tetraurelia strain d4-2]